MCPVLMLPVWATCAFTCVNTSADVVGEKNLELCVVHCSLRGRSNFHSSMVFGSFLRILYTDHL